MFSQYSKFLTFSEFFVRLRGVVTVADIANMLGTSDSTAVNRCLRKLVDQEILSRIKPGIYVTTNFSPEVLSQRIYPESYLSLGSVLARALVIGSIPEKTVYAVKTGRKREFRGESVRLSFFGISTNHFFGWELRDGIRYALPEKALIDLLYFYQKGFKPSINIYQDLNLKMLDINILADLLTSYRNKKFIKFVTNLLQEYGY